MATTTRKKAAPKKAAAPEEKAKAKALPVNSFEKFRNAKQANDQFARKPHLVYLDTEEEGRHLVDVRQLPDDIFNSLELIK